MKKVILAALAALFFYGCNCPKHKITDDVFGGNHALVPTKIDSITGERLYVKFVGDKMRYAWMTNDTECVTSLIPVTKVRVKINDNASTPYIKYRWIPGKHADGDIQSLVDTWVVYAVLVCSVKDCPEELAVPIQNAAPAEEPSAE